MKLILNNNKTKLVGLTKQILKLRDLPEFCIRSKGAFFSPAFRKRQWDGMIRFITESGVIDTGKVPQLLKVMAIEFPKEPIEIVDERDFASNKIFKKLEVPKKIESFEARKYQVDTVKSITENMVGGVLFPRGIVGAATNAGKTLISVMIHKTYNTKTLFIISSKELLEQAIEEIPQMIPGEVGILASGYKLEWKPFMIVMVKSAKSWIHQVEQKFTSYPVVLVDECDLATSKTYREVLNYTYNSYVRVGLSGSAFADPRQKEKNERLRAIFGDLLYEISNKTLMDAGYSSDVKVYMWEGNVDIKVPGNYKEEYRLGIVENYVRNSRVVGRAMDHVRRGRNSVLIITKEHQHVRNLFRLLKEKTNGSISIGWVHHEAKLRASTVKRFKEGKIKILVGSYILKRGKNFPLMNAIVCAGGGDSLSGVLQILGRATRKHHSKEFTILDDFYDRGKYLLRHSKHRLSKYVDQKIEVNKKF
jgi:superfamily II DNA or RNA helicase